MPTNQQTSTILANQSGFVLVMAILVMVVLAIIGLSTTKDAQLNLLIAGNDKLQKQNFYKAEGAAMEEAQTIENASAASLLNQTVQGLTAQAALSITPLTTDTQEGTIITATLKSASVVPATSTLSGANSTTRCLAIDKGAAAGSSLSVTQSQVHTYHIFGYSSENNSESIISLGYKKRW